MKDDDDDEVLEDVVTQHHHKHLHEHEHDHQHDHEHEHGHKHEHSHKGHHMGGEALNLFQTGGLGGGHTGWGAALGAAGGAIVGEALGIGRRGHDGYGAGAAVAANYGAEVLEALGDIKAEIPIVVGGLNLATSQQTQTLQQMFFTGMLQNQESLCGVKSAVCETGNNIVTAITTGNYAILGAIRDQGDRITAQATGFRIADLEQRLTVAELDKRDLHQSRERDQNSHNQTVTVMTNQQQTQAQFQQLNNTLGFLGHQLADVQQYARATNSNVIVGNTGASTTGAQTASPTNVRA